MNTKVTAAEDMIVGDQILANGEDVWTICSIKEIRNGLLVIEFQIAGRENEGMWDNTYDPRHTFKRIS